LTPQNQNLGGRSPPPPEGESGQRNQIGQPLRRFFEVDRHSVVLATLDALARTGHVPMHTVVQAIERYGIDAESAAP